MGNREERPTLEELYENVEMDDSLSESEMKIVKEQIRREYPSSGVSTIFFRS